MTTDHIQLAWAAGLFEGEGNFSQYEYKGVNGSIYYPRAALVSSDKDILERFQEIVGLGNITSKKKNLGKKDMWVWQTGSVEKTQALYAMLWKWLGERRKDRIREIVLCSRQGIKVSVAPYIRSDSVQSPVVVPGRG